MFRLNSPAFDDGQQIAQKYGKKDQNLSPPLAWDGAPEGTKSFALSFVDIHPVARGYVHWLIADIGPEVNSLPEGAAGGRNTDFTELEPYAGPFPPSGTHDYEFRLYALRTDRLGVREPPWRHSGRSPSRTRWLSRGLSAVSRRSDERRPQGCGPSSRTPLLACEPVEDLHIASTGLRHDLRRNCRPWICSVPIPQR
jgi:Raf kinase inhibitor-like YbhB/YbcL family protein